MISRNDILLIFFLALLAAASFFWIRFHQESGSTVSVTIDGKEYGRYALNEDQEIEIKEEDFINKINISQGKVSMTQADCPDQICVNHKAICNNGETIVCLPHKLVITVEKEGESDQNNIDIIVK